MPGASERLSLILSAQTSGEEALARLEQRINQVLATANRTSAVGDQVGKASAQTSSSLEKFGESLKDFVSNPLAVAEQQAQSFAKTLGPLGIGITVATTAVTAATTAYIAWAEALGDVAEQTLNMSIRTGLNVKEVQQFSFAAKLAGVDSGAFQTAMKTLSATLTDNSAEAEKTRKQLRELGISLRDQSGSLKSSGQLWQDLGDAIGNVEEPFKRAHIAQQVFGKGGKELLPLLSELKGSLAELKDIGVIFDEKTAKQLDDNADRLVKIEKILTGIKDKSKINFVLGFTEETKTVLGFLSRFSANGGTLGDIVGAAGIFFPGTQAGSLSSIDAVARKGALGFNLPGISTQIAPGVGVVGTRTDNRIGFIDSLNLQRPTISGSTDQRDIRARASINSFLGGLSGNNIDALKSVVDEAKEKRDEAVSKLKDLAVNGGADVIALQREEVKKLSAEYARLELQLEQLEKLEAERKRLAELTVETLTLTGPSSTRAPRLLRGGEQVSFTPGGQFVIDETDINAANAGRFAADADIANARLAGEARRGNPAGDRALQSIRQSLDFQARKIELLTGPGGELEAVRKIANARLDALEKEKEISGDSFDLEQRRREVALDTELQILSIRRSALNVGKDQLFGLVTGQTSTSQFAKNTALTIGRNAFSKVYDAYLGPELGKIGAASGLGGLLSGTAFDPAQRNGIDGNTRATDDNTTALRNLTAVMAGSTLTGGLLSGGGTAGIPGIFGGGASNSGYGSIFSLLGIGGGKSTAQSATLPVVDELGANYPQASLASSQPGLGKLARGVGIAGAGIAGAFGIYSGIRQGGLRGGLSAGGSAAGAASAILPLIGISGPAAPILAGAALGLELIKGFLPDPKVARDRRINSILDSAAFSGPSSTIYEEDTYGRSSYYDKRGNLQPVIVHQTVEAWDSKNFIDNRSLIADATRQAMQEAHALNDEIRAVSGGY